MANIVIAAIDDRHGFGKNGSIPWYIPDDFRFFKAATLGGTCFMGRNTYNEIARMREGKPDVLPGRHCVVFTRSPMPKMFINVSVCSDMHDWESYKQPGTDSFFIGGLSVYEFALKEVPLDTILLSRIPGDHDCDVFFPYADVETGRTCKRHNVMENLIVEEWTNAIE